jgi:hypothetical protein
MFVTFITLNINSRYFHYAGGLSCVKHSADMQAANKEGVSMCLRGFIEGIAA